jgi:hypothetical protein
MLIDKCLGVLLFFYVSTVFSYQLKPIFSIHNREYARFTGQLKMAGFDTIIDVSSTYETDCSPVRDSSVSLDDYMQLPVEQYVCIKMPLDATLERMHTTVFNLTVPPVKFFHLEVSPMLVCDVIQDDSSVVIRSNIPYLFRT